MKTISVLLTFISFLSVAHAGQSMPVERLMNLGLLNEGTQIGQCEVVKSTVLREYGSGPVSGVQITVSNGKQEVMALLATTVDVSDGSAANQSKVVISKIDSTTGGDSHLSRMLEKNTSLSVTLEIKEVEPTKGQVTRLIIEKKKANFFGSMKTVANESIDCGE